MHSHAVVDHPAAGVFLNRYLLLALFSAVCMASSGIIARYSQLSAAELTFCRLAVGALCLGLFLLLSGQGRQLKRRPDRTVIINGMLLASFMLGFLQAIQSISLANAIMLVYLAPPLTAVVAHFLYGEKLTLLSLLFIALSVLGFAMLQQFQLDLALTPAQLPGFGFAVFSLLTYAGFLLLNRKPLSVQSATSAYQRSFYQLLLGACCVVPFLTNSHLPPVTELPWILLAGIFPGFLAIVGAVVALQHLPVRVFGTLAYIEPVTVILAGWWLFQEVLMPVQLAGVLLILGCGVAQAALARPSPTPVTTASCQQP
jgi:drug/metabolite transporter (DMT)-like permease